MITPTWLEFRATNQPWAVTSAVSTTEITTRNTRKFAGLISRKTTVRHLTLTRKQSIIPTTTRESF
jgi:hypothetical protein